MGQLFELDGIEEVVVLTARVTELVTGAVTVLLVLLRAVVVPVAVLAA